MSRINQVLAEEGANICGQYLGTKGSVGYVIVDLNVEASSAVKRSLQALDTVLRVRVLH